MKTTDNNKSLEDSLRHKGKNKVNTVFFKLLAKQANVGNCPILVTVSIKK